MTDKKISQLPEITTPASADIIPVVDIDANTTKKITAANLSTFINSSFPTETIRDTIGAMLTGNTETDITVTHDDSNDKIDFVVSVSASNLPNNIDATKIGDGSVSNAEFQRLDGLTADIQTQIDTKVSKSGDTMSGTLAMGINAITTSSTVDGRDVATDGSKLDGIEAGATADQTNTEIRAAVEAASDSNVFTDADHSKLNAIEASATADQTDAEIRAAVEAASDSNVFTDTDHTKLNGIEASADVTDATNVTAAGALMDSELTNVAAVKGINQALTTTSSPTFAGITGPLTGNASTASTLATARTINLGGEVTGSASFNGGSDITITGTIAANTIGVNELALNDGSSGQFIQTDGAGTITFASAIGSSVINNAAANRITTVNANTNDFDAETNLTFDGSTLALTGNMTASGTIDGVDISARDAVLTSTTTTANAALPKAGGAMTGAITSATAFTIDSADDINLDAAGNAVRFKSNGNEIGQVSLASSDLAISASVQDKDIIFKGNDGGSTITALTLDMSGSGQAVFGSSVFVGNHFYLNDNKKAHFGDSEDLQIYHDGSNSKIETTSGSTGDLYIASQRAGSDLYLRAEHDILIQPQGGENGIAVRGDGGVVIYNDNGFKFETDGQGANISGLLDVSSKVVVAGGTDATSSDGAIRTAGGISAAKKAYVGTDLTVDNNIIVAGTVDGVDVAACNTTANAALARTGGSMTGQISFGDNIKANFGAGDDLQIYHSGSKSYVSDQGTGNLAILGTNIEINNAADSKNMITLIDGGSANLFHNGNNKLQTTASGVTVTGTLTATTLAGSLPYSSLTGTPTVPTNNNQLTNGAGYVTSSGVTSVATGNGLSGGTITSTGTLTMSGSYSGSFSATGNITAYSSDQRLKNFKGKIENALDKVEQLNGYYYEWNDTAKSIDAEAFKDGVEIGINAQEVEAVMPEVVTEAPIVKIHELDTDNKTVYYDNIVPLLIEAIKELKGELEELKKDK